MTTTSSSRRRRSTLAVVVWLAIACALGALLPLSVMRARRGDAVNAGDAGSGENAAQRVDGDDRVKLYSPRSTALVRHLFSLPWVERRGQVGAAAADAYAAWFVDDDVASRLVVALAALAPRSPIVVPALVWLIDVGQPSVLSAVLARHRVADRLLDGALHGDDNNHTDADADADADADNARIGQLLLFGAGYDTKSLRFGDALDARSVRVFEVDLAAVQRHKVNVLRRRLSSSAFDALQSRTCFIGYRLPSHQRNDDDDDDDDDDDEDGDDEDDDDDDDDDDDANHNNHHHRLFFAPSPSTPRCFAAFSTRTPTFVMIEGVLPYFSVSSVRRLLRAVHAHTSPHSTLLFDTLLAGVARTRDDWLLDATHALANEPLRFEMPVDVGAFLSPLGWRVRDVLRSAQLDGGVLGGARHYPPWMAIVVAVRDERRPAVTHPNAGHAHDH